MTIYPYTIDNGHGERLTFVRRVQTDAEDYVEVETHIQPKAGPPMHVHYLQEEALTIISGRMAYQIQGQEIQYTSTGETVRFAPGVAHRFWNDGDGILHCTGYARPANNLEYFLSQLYASTKSSGGNRPDSFDIAYLLTRYKSEFGMLVIPSFVQKFIFPAQLAIGRLLGKYDKYQDAPSPIAQTEVKSQILSVR